MEQNFKFGDTVTEIGTDSGWWIVAETFPITRTNKKAFARIVLRGHPHVEAFVDFDRLRRAKGR